jgi:hypothetical protein
MAFSSLVIQITILLPYSLKKRKYGDVVGKSSPRKGQILVVRAQNVKKSGFPHCGCTYTSMCLGDFCSFTTSANMYRIEFVCIQNVGLSKNSRLIDVGANWTTGFGHMYMQFYLFTITSSKMHRLECFFRVRRVRCVMEIHCNNFNTN